MNRLVPLAREKAELLGPKKMMPRFSDEIFIVDRVNNHTQRATGDVTRLSSIWALYLWCAATSMGCIIYQQRRYSFMDTLAEHSHRSIWAIGATTSGIGRVGATSAGTSCDCTGSGTVDRNIPKRFTSRCPKHAH